MPKGILVIESSPAPGRDDDYNNWYNNIHLIDVLKLAGFTSARRFSALGESTHPYLAIYEIEADDLEAAQAGLGKAAQEGKLPISDAFGLEPAPKTTLYTQIYELAG